MADRRRIRRVAAQDSWTSAMKSRFTSKQRRMICQEMSTRRKLEIGQCQCGTCDNRVTIDNLHHFDFDHIDPSTKVDSISNLVRHGHIDRLKKEIPKCRLLFVTCHRDHTKEQQRHGFGFPALQLQWSLDRQPSNQDGDFIFKEGDFFVTRDRNLHIIRCTRISTGKEYRWHQDIGYYEYTGPWSLLHAMTKETH